MSHRRVATCASTATDWKISGLARLDQSGRLSPRSIAMHGGSGRSMRSSSAVGVSSGSYSVWTYTALADLDGPISTCVHERTQHVAHAPVPELIRKVAQAVAQAHLRQEAAEGLAAVHVPLRKERRTVNEELQSVAEAVVHPLRKRHNALPCTTPP